jgi:hypothetical protein
MIASGATAMDMVTRVEPKVTRGFANRSATGGHSGAPKLLPRFSGTGLRALNEGKSLKE